MCTQFHDVSVATPVHCLDQCSSCELLHSRCLFVSAELQCEPTGTQSPKNGALPKHTQQMYVSKNLWQCSSRPAVLQVLCRSLFEAFVSSTCTDAVFADFKSRKKAITPDHIKSRNYFAASHLNGTAAPSRKSFPVLYRSSFV
jgi:hypothetical protein